MLAIGCITLGVEPARREYYEPARIAVLEARWRELAIAAPSQQMIVSRSVDAVDECAVTVVLVGLGRHVPEFPVAGVAPRVRHVEHEQHAAEQVNRGLHRGGIGRVDIEGVENAGGGNAGDPGLPAVDQRSLVEAIVAAAEPLVIALENRFVERRLGAVVPGEGVVAVGRRRACSRRAGRCRTSGRSTPWRNRSAVPGPASRAGSKTIAADGRSSSPGDHGNERSDPIAADTLACKSQSAWDRPFGIEGCGRVRDLAIEMVVQAQAG